MKIILESCPHSKGVEISKKKDWSFTHHKVPQTFLKYFTDRTGHFLEDLRYKQGISQKDHPSSYPHKNTRHIWEMENTPTST